MTESEAMQDLISRYDCQFYQGEWGVHCYFKDITLIINFEEDIQKWGKGNIWKGSKQEWSTGEFAERRKLTTAELFNVLDIYLPKRTEISLFEVMA